MSANPSFERQLAAWMADEAGLSLPDGALDVALTATSRVRPRPRWLALLRETPMQTPSRVLVGSPTTRRVAIALTALLLALAAVAAGALLLGRTAAADDWTAFRGGPGRAGAAAHGPMGHGVVAAQFHANANLATAIAIVGSTAYTTSSDGVTYAIDIATARERWTFKAPAGTAGDVAVSDDVVYVSDGGRHLYALDAATGAQRWASPEVAVASDITFGGGRIYVGTRDGAIVALDAATGQQRWRTPLPGAAASVHNPAYADGRVFAAFDSGALVAIDAATGKVDWQAALGPGIVATSVVAAGVVYIGAGSDETTGHLRAFEAATGKPLWDVPEAYGAPAVSDGVAYAALQVTGEIAAFDVGTGRMRWHVRLPGHVRAPAVADGVVYVSADEDHGVYALAASDGWQLWRVGVDDGNGCCIAVARGHVFVGTHAGTMFIIGGDGLTASPVPVAEVSPSPAPHPSAASSWGPQPVSLVWAGRGTVSAWAPTNVTQAPDGKLWVTDGYNHRFTIFDATGRYLEAWGSYGTAEGQFNLRRANGDAYGAIAFAPDGSFYVLDVGNFRVQAFDKDRRFVRSWGTFGRAVGHFIDPVAIAVTPDGSIAVLDDDRGVIERYDSSGKVLGSFDAFPNATPGTNAANSMAVDAKGDFYVSDIEPFQVDRFDPAGKLTGTIGAGRFADQPGNMVVDGIGRLFVDQGGGRGSDPGVLVFDPSGTYLAAFGYEGDPEIDVRWPTGMVFVDGDLVLADVADPEHPDAARLLRLRLLSPLAP